MPKEYRQFKPLPVALRNLAIALNSESVQSLSTGGAEETIRAIDLSTFLACDLKRWLRRDNKAVIRTRGWRRVLNECAYYRGNYSDKEENSTKNNIDKVCHTGQKVAGEYCPET